jgi:hypothetical protein
MTETTDTNAQDVSTGQAKRPRGVIFVTVNILAMILLPAAIAVSLLIITILSPGFYTGILKQARFITAFVEAKNAQTDGAINEEIEKELDLAGADRTLAKAKSRFDKADKEYGRLYRDGEEASLESRRAEIKDMDWKREKENFATKDKFKAYRAEELAKVDQAMDLLDAYRDENADGIKAALKEKKEAQEEYDDALSSLEVKKKKADRIIEKHSDTTSNRIYGDLELIEEPLTRILNEKLFDGPVRDEIAFMLDFLSDYDAQVGRGTVYYGRTPSGRRSLMVKIPEISVSLRADDGAGRKRHVLSQLMVEEIDRTYSLRSKTLLRTIFSMSDSSLGEYLGGKQLAKLGLKLDGGVIRRPAGVLYGETADTVALLMQILSYGKYAPHVTAALLALYLAFLLFSSVEGRRRLAALKRFLLYPSFLVLALCGLLLWSSRYLLDLHPGFIENIMARSFVKHLSFLAAWGLCMPICILFGGMFVAGLVLRAVLARAFAKRPA